jgi:C2 domain
MESFGGKGDKIWCERRHYRLDDVEITKLNGKIMEVKLGNGNETVVRDLRFESNTEAIRCRDAVERLKILEKERAARQIAKFKGASVKKKSESRLMLGSTGTIEEDDETDDDEHINLLVEIVSATDLPIADIISTDAYVIVRMKGREVHRTDVISNNLSPIWTIATGSLFLIETTPEEFFASSSGLTFVIKDKDTLGSNEVIGSVNILPEVLLTGTGKRLGYDIALADSFAKKPVAEKKPRLYLRFKSAAKEDIEFMHEYRSHHKKFGVYADETVLSLRDPEFKFPRRQEKKGLVRLDLVVLC